MEIFNRLRGGCLTLVGGAVLLCAAAIFLPMLMGDPEPAYNPNDYEDEPRTSENRNQEDNFPVLAQNANSDLGQLVATTRLDRDGCPVSSENTFRSGDSIYVVAVDSEIEEGTEIFARMYFDNMAIEDTAPIVASQDYGNTCVNFIFEPQSYIGLQDGSYEVEFIVNGNPTDSITFRVQ